jgi:tRNA (mo5U34)-methyltransferase
MDQDIREKIQQARWYHSFEVLPGVITPGEVPFDARGALDYLGVPGDLRGQRALDVGTYDGPFAFEMEARGAEVYAVDVQDPDCTAFNTARALRNSRVEYRQLSVYDLDKVFTEPFDLITYFGVYYHLKHPILGFEALARVLAKGGSLYFEGELLLNYSETITGTRSNLDNRQLAESDVPLTLCYPGDYKGWSNWFVPNLTCLRGWMEAAGLEITRYEMVADENPPYPKQRIVGIARKTADLDIVPESWLWEKGRVVPDSWMRQFRRQREYRQKHADAIKAVLPRTAPAPEVQTVSSTTTPVPEMPKQRFLDQVVRMLRWC